MLAVGDLDDERDADWCGKESVVEVWRARTFWKRGGRWCPRLLRCDDATLAVVDEAGEVETSFELRDVAWAEDARRELSVAFRSRADEALVAFDDEASLRSWVDFVAAMSALRAGAHAVTAALLPREVEVEYEQGVRGGDARVEVAAAGAVELHEALDVGERRLQEGTGGVAERRVATDVRPAAAPQVGGQLA